MENDTETTITIVFWGNIGEGHGNYYEKKLVGFFELASQGRQEEGDTCLHVFADCHANSHPSPSFKSQGN